jgi:hypothetical protein
MSGGVSAICACCSRSCSGAFGLGRGIGKALPSCLRLLWPSPLWLLLLCVPLPPRATAQGEAPSAEAKWISGQVVHRPLVCTESELEPSCFYLNRLTALNSRSSQVGDSSHKQSDDLPETGLICQDSGHIPTGHSSRYADVTMAQQCDQTCSIDAKQDSGWTYISTRAKWSYSHMKGVQVWRR